LLSRLAALQGGNVDLLSAVAGLQRCNVDLLSPVAGLLSSNAGLLFRGFRSCLRNRAFNSENLIHVFGKYGLDKKYFDGQKGLTTQSSALA
jgi:hypothetical protein